MDSFQAALTSFTVLAIILLMVVFVCHYLGPRTTAWFRSNREEKIGLSKSKLFNANGYMIHSGSEFLQLSNTGSFKRFDSIDRDYKQVGHNSGASASPWNIPTTDIPPQPLRPAPAPKLLRQPSSPAILNGTIYNNNLEGYGKTEFQSAEINQFSNHFPPTQLFSTQIIEKPIKQRSLENVDKSTNINPIPRPVAKRQLSSPIKKENCLLLNNNSVSKSQRSPTIKKENGILLNNNNNINNSSLIITNNKNKVSFADFEEKFDERFKQYQSAVVTPFAITDSSNNTISVGAKNCLNTDPMPSYSNKEISFSSDVVGYSPPKHTKEFIPRNLQPQENPQIHLVRTSNKNRTVEPATSVTTGTLLNNTSKEPILKKLSNNVQEQQSSSNTNPFLTNGFGNSSETLDNLSVASYKKINIVNPINFSNSHTSNITETLLIHQNNPFTGDHIANQCSDSNDFDLLPDLKEPPKTAHAINNTVFDFDIQSKFSSGCDEREISSLHKSSMLSKSIELINTNEMIIKKYLDSPSTDVSDEIDKINFKKKQYRNRSLSETEITDFNLKYFTRNTAHNKSFNTNTNPFLSNATSNIQKTFSENYLTRHFSGFNNVNFFYNLQQQQQQSTWSFRTLQRQDSNFSLGRRNSSQSSLNDSDVGSSIDSINLERAISCESVSSQSSVNMSDLEPVVAAITGHLCIGLQYDKGSMTDEGIELLITVMEAKELIGPSPYESFDTFVRVYLVPDEKGVKQTRVFKNSTSPSYNETFNFWLGKKRGKSSLWFHLYHNGTSVTLIGEAEMQISDVTATRPLTTWLPLSDAKQNVAKWGELMFSLSYLPTAERLKVVVVKARNLKLDQHYKESNLDFQNIFVKVYLLKENRKVSKKRTSLKRKDRCPIFNESMIFSIPPYALNSIQVRLTVSCISSDATNSEFEITIGHVIVGAHSGERGVRHWNQMLSSLRKPVAMWHPLRKLKNRSLITS